MSPANLTRPPASPPRTGEKTGRRPAAGGFKGLPAVQEWWRRRESNPGPKTLHSRFYVRSRQFESPRGSPVGGLSPALVTCLFSPARPVTRRSAIQLGYALGRVLEDPSFGRRSVLFRQRARMRCRSQSWVARLFTWGHAPRYAANEIAVSVETDRPPFTEVL